MRAGTSWSSSGLGFKLILDIMLVKNTDILFDEFIRSYDGLNYVVWSESRSFDISEHEEITLDLLDTLFASVQYPGRIEGTLESCSFESAVAYINQQLGHKPGYFEEEMLDAKEHEKRKNIFWSLVGSQIKLPPQKTYEHVAFYNSLLGFGTYWNFCYIFVNEQKAFAIAMGAAD